ncbi:MAG: dTDP-4-dehydrorhamnose 3,5-epimerase [Bacteroidales bacterium]
MELIKTDIEDVLLIQPKSVCRRAWYFLNPFDLIISFPNSATRLISAMDSDSFGKGVLRGLHFQNPPYEQGKLVRVIKGAVLDVAVDIRPESPTYGKWVSYELNEKNKTMMWIPPGFAHGFVTLMENSIFQYKCTNYYNKESEGSIRWNDPDINIDWKTKNPIVSGKDKVAPLFKNFESQF